MSTFPTFAALAALVNDTYIGYTYDIIVRYKVRWIEAAAALPAWTSMLCFYIEGTKGHFMEEHCLASMYSKVVRGNMFSYHMPWERILQSLELSLIHI